MADKKKGFLSRLRDRGKTEDPFGNVKDLDKDEKISLTGKIRLMRKTPAITTPRPIQEERKDIKIPGLLVFKRIIGVFLCINYLIFGWGMIQNFKPYELQNVYLFWIFVLSFWIAKDYVWKTRIKKTEAFKINPFSKNEEGSIEKEVPKKRSLRDRVRRGKKKDRPQKKKREKVILRRKTSQASRAREKKRKEIEERKRSKDESDRLIEETEKVLGE